MDFCTSDTSSAAGDTTGDETFLSSADDPDQTEESSGSELPESEESSNAAIIAAAVDEEVDIINVIDEGTSSRKRERSRKSKLTGSMEIEGEEDDDSTIVSSESDSESESESESELFFSSSAVGAEDQESSESDEVEVVEEEEEGKTESPVYDNLPPNFPVKFTTLVLEPNLMRPRILMEKRLRRVESDGDELTIPGKKMKEAFLVPEEDEKLKSGEFMEVELVERDGFTVRTLKLSRRRVGHGQPPSYVLTGGWNYVMDHNRDALRRGRFIRVWYFRVNGLLWFALQVVKEKKKNSEIEKEITKKWYAQRIFFP